MVRFGASIYCISREIEGGRITPEAAVEWLAENGAQVLELVPFGMDFAGDSGLADRVRRTAERVKLPIGNYSLNANFLQLTMEEYGEAISRAKRHIDAAASMGSPCIRIDCAGFRRPVETNTIECFMEELPTVVEAYETLCTYGDRHNMLVLLENHGFHVNGADRVRQVLAGVGNENFGLQMDVGNFICVDDDPEAAVKKTAAFAKTVHMKDFYIRPGHRDPGDATQFDCAGSWFRSVGGKYLRGAILGQGDLDIYEIMRLIKAFGYEGDIFLEYEGMEDCYYATKVSLDNMRRIYGLV